METSSLRPKDKSVCCFSLKFWSYEGQYDAQADKFINVRQNEDNVRECDFEDVSRWSYVDIPFTLSLLKQHPQSATKEFIDQMKVWGVWPE